MPHHFSSFLRFPIIFGTVGSPKVAGFFRSPNFFGALSGPFPVVGVDPVLGVLVVEVLGLF